MAAFSKKYDTSEEMSWELEQFVTYRIARLNAQLNQQATRLLSQISDLTLGQWRVLAAIAGGKATTSKKVHDVTKIDTGLISRLLRQLEIAELIETQRNKEDRRVLDVKLTIKGLDTFTTILPVMTKRQENLLQEFSTKDFESLNLLFDKLQEAVSDESRSFRLRNNNKNIKDL